jgi:hypothetical protein
MTKAGYGKAGKQKPLSNFPTATTTTKYIQLWDTDSRGKAIMVTGFQEQFLGVSGTRPPHNSLNRNFFQASPNRLTLLTDLFNISNTKTVPDNPTKPHHLEAQAHPGLSLPKEGTPFLD